jgi:capsular exopolysaccharide synthesis family protein
MTGGYEAEIIAPPGPGLKVAPRPLLVFTAAILLGLLAGFGLATMAELSDQSFRTPEEIRRRLGMPVVGHVPYFEPDERAVQPADGSPALDPILCTVHHPKSREAEGYRGVRTALLFNAREGKNKVIQVTSPDTGDGKSTLASNLAISLAQAEKRVILIDADFRRPRQHKLFGVSAERGLASVINGEAELCEVIQETAVEGLFVLPCGPIPPNPAELLTLTRFQELLALIRDQYDFVVIDTPPLLAVTDPCVVVPHVDAVILTVRISKNARPHATRARDILTTLGAKVLGVVVNGVGRDIKGYGYDSYRYGYAYKYYNYQAYGDQKEASPKANGNSGDHSNKKGGLPSTHQPARGAASRKSKGFLTWLFNR